MSNILSKKDAIRKLEEYDTDFVMSSKYDSKVGISTEPQQIEKGKDIIADATSEDISYIEDVFAKMFQAQTGKQQLIY